jgi:hypothetical protein
VLHPFGGDEFIGDFADHRRLAVHQQYFQAIVMVQVYMHRRKNHVVMIVPDVRGHSRKGPVFVNGRVVVFPGRLDIAPAKSDERSFLCAESKIQAVWPLVNL